VCIDRAQVVAIDLCDVCEQVAMRLDRRQRVRQIVDVGEGCWWRRRVASRAGARARSGARAVEARLVLGQMAAAAKGSDDGSGLAAGVAFKQQRVVAVADRQRRVVIVVRWAAGDAVVAVPASTADATLADIAITLAATLL
jgi:hypothetical protein